MKPSIVVYQKEKILLQFQTILFSYKLCVTVKRTYRKVVSSNTSRFETHAGLFRLLMKGIFDAYVL